MTTCESLSLACSDTGNSIGVLGGKLSIYGKLGMRMADGKGGSWSHHHRTVSQSPNFRCVANHRVASPNNSITDGFLNLQAEISLLRGDGSSKRMNSPRNDGSSGIITENFRDASTTSNYNEAKIKVIGVVGWGSNAVNRMIESSMKGVEFWLVNTDIQAMRMSPVFPKNHLQIGQELT